MSNGNGHHWSKFAWRDWSADKALHPCSLAARGFWIEMLCIMHEGAPIGHLTLGGNPATIHQMAANAYCTEKEATKCLAELEAAGVFSRTTDGTIYSRRMVKDAALSAAGREHIAKRWNNTDKHPPPNRGPNSEPISHPNNEPSSRAFRDPNRDPISPSLSPPDPLFSSPSESESEREPPLPPTGRGGSSHRSNSPKPFKTGAFGLVSQEGSSAAGNNVTPISAYTSLPTWTPKRATN